MTHKNTLVFGVCALLCAIGLFGISRVNAASVGLTSMFQNGEHAKYTIFDMDQEGNNVTTYLPDPSENDGTLLIYKRIGLETNYYIAITPEVGTFTIEGTDAYDGGYLLTDPKQFIIFLGDATNNTWWIVGDGTL